MSFNKQTLQNTQDSLFVASQKLKTASGKLRAKIDGKDGTGVGKIAKAGGSLYVLILLLVLYTPLALIIIFSFSNTSNFTFRNGFSIEGYLQIFKSSSSPKLFDSLYNTIVIAIIATIASTILGTFAAIGIFAMKKRTRRITETVNQLPVINSEIVMAVSLVLLFVALKFPTGYIRLIFGHIAFCTPYVILSITPRLMTLDKNLYEAALDLGASPLRAMVTVIIPVIMPGILSGAAMAFTLSLDDFIISQLNKGATTGIDTLSTYIYSSQHNARGLNPFWFAVFSIIIVLVITIVLVLNLIKIKQKKGIVKTFR
ncbi:MAG: ABC transporter permease [Christensenellaceae bacterium]|jgi:spermidine/putrescine transport system permease protein|nr:ABC transporter permease [Christensenellaceae bacterium]